MMASELMSIIKDLYRVTLGRNPWTPLVATFMVLFIGVSYPIVRYNEEIAAFIKKVALVFVAIWFVLPYAAKHVFNLARDKEHERLAGKQRNDWEGHINKIFEEAKADCRVHRFQEKFL